MKKSKEERQRDRRILDLYHKHMTEKELEPLFDQFKQWKSGELPYFELTEFIHQFHKKNQEIYKTFHYYDDEHLVFRAKKELNMFNEKDLENEAYQRWMYYYER